MILCQVSSCGYLWIHRFIQKNIYWRAAMQQTWNQWAYKGGSKRQKKYLCPHGVFILRGRDSQYTQEMNKIYGVLDKSILYPYGKNKTGKRAGQKGATILSRFVRELHTEKAHLSKGPKLGKGRKPFPILEGVWRRIFLAERLVSAKALHREYTRPV